MPTLEELIAQKPIRYAENPYWEFSNGEIVNKQGRNMKNVVASIVEMSLPYFNTVYDAFKTEAQILFLTDADYQRLPDKSVPELRLPILDVTHDHALVLPQTNTAGNTIVSESWWSKNLANRDIFPLARIHSHHILKAYQSNTDWSYLNSGSLEIVAGHITSDKPQIAFWLDVRGTDQKDTVFKSLDSMRTYSQIENGKNRILTKTQMMQAGIFGSDFENR